MAFVEERLKELEKGIAGNQDALEELELVLEEEELIPCKFGDVFVHCELELVKEQLVHKNEVMATEAAALKSQVAAFKTSIAQMKADLYTKFGNSIQLEYD